MNNQPIGILDSGLGGLTVWREIVAKLPHESIVYIGDSKNTPYGNKTPDEIFALAERSIQFLLSKDAKVIVTACNSITVSCVTRLRERFAEVPIVGTVPAIKPAASVSKNKRIGILATTRTKESDYQKKLIDEFASDCTVIIKGTDDLVPLIENGELRGTEMTLTLQDVLADFKQENVDSLVLGCTHFPFLRDQMQEILGPGVTIVDSGEAIARRVQWILENYNLSSDPHKPQYSFYTTGDPQVAKNVLIATMKWEETPEVSAITL